MRRCRVEIFTGSLSATTLTVLPVMVAGEDIERAAGAGAVDVDRIDAALAVDVGGDAIGRAVDVDVLLPLVP